MSKKKKIVYNRSNPSTMADWKKAAALRVEGKSYIAIGKILNISKTAVERWVRWGSGVTPPPGSPKPEPDVVIVDEAHVKKEAEAAMVVAPTAAAVVAGQRFHNKANPSREANWAQALKMKQEGMPLDAIATKLGIHKTTAFHWIQWAREGKPPSEGSRMGKAWGRDEDFQKAKALSDAGMTSAQVARELVISNATAIRWIRKASEPDAYDNSGRLRKGGYGPRDPDLAAGRAVQMQQAARMAREGKSQTDIAKHFGISTITVRAWILEGRARVAEGKVLPERVSAVIDGVTYVRADVVLQRIIAMFEEVDKAS